MDDNTNQDEPLQPINDTNQTIEHITGICVFMNILINCMSYFGMSFCCLPLLHNMHCLFMINCQLNFYVHFSINCLFFQLSDPFRGRPKEQPMHQRPLGNRTVSLSWHNFHLVRDTLLMQFLRRYMKVKIHLNACRTLMVQQVTQHQPVQLTWSPGSALQDIFLSYIQKSLTCV